MRPYVILAGVVAALLLLLLLSPRRGPNNGTQPAPEAAPEALAATNAPPDEGVTRNDPGRTAPDTGSVGTYKSAAHERWVRSYNENANTPVVFCGQVLDQDTNPLQNVQVAAMVAEEYVTPSLQTTGTTTIVEKRTGADGRFEVTGFKAHRVTITRLAKDGYEPELGISDIYGIYGAQSGSFTEPVVFRMWSTNIPHEHLITGKASSAVIPDGRPYGIDLTNQTIAEGAGGDLVVWIKRPPTLGFGDRYGWSCELTATEGRSLEESRDSAMCVAPVAGYTNEFAYQQEAGADAWSPGLYRKSFYIRVRNNQIYGRATLNLSSSPGRDGPAIVWLEYTLNPSGSRILR